MIVYGNFWKYGTEILENFMLDENSIFFTFLRISIFFFENKSVLLLFSFGKKTKPIDERSKTIYFG